MYSVKEENGQLWVEYSGLRHTNDRIPCIPYHSKKQSYVNPNREEDCRYVDMFDTDVFDTWINEYSNTERKKVKNNMISTDKHNELREISLDHPRRSDITVMDDVVVREFAVYPFPRPATSPVTQMLMNLVTCSSAPAETVTVAKKATKCVDTPKETNMNTTDNMELTQRRALQAAAANMECEKINAARSHFKMDDDDVPSTPEELLERFASGNYTLVEKSQRKRWADSPLEHFRWRHPSSKADEAGYQAARRKLRELRASLDIDLMVDPLADAKKALRKFEKETIH